MGSRGASSGKGAGKGVATSKRIKEEAIEEAINSKLKGVARDARNGTGNYTFKDYKAVGDKDLEKMVDTRTHEVKDNTLVIGRIGQTGVVYGNKTDSSQIKKYKAKKQEQKEKREAEIRANSNNRPEIRTTSTYDRWKKKHDKDFAAWFWANRS